jgi:hypothetical protein
MQTIGPIDVDEIKLIVAKFPARDLGTAVVVSAQWFCEVAAGEDAGAAGRLTGPSIIEPNAVKRRVEGAVLGATYNIRCVATDSAGLKHVAAGLLSAVRLVSG